MSQEGKIAALRAAEDGEREPLVGNIKVTREDWLNVALDVLISEGIGEVKILTIGERLNVSRSSFYWYFKSRQDLLDALLQHWQATNTAALVEHASMPAATITESVCNVFRCSVNGRLFDNALDFAVRDWARRSGKVRKIVDQSDQARLEALAQMFRRFDYQDREALTRARILYFMQIGYNVAELNETLTDRMKFLPEYLRGFTGVAASDAEIAAFKTYANEVYSENPL
ncbi:MAG: TetR/AcrR family transcriptional regulator [Rhizobiaceae bacterium]